MGAVPEIPSPTLKQFKDLYDQMIAMGLTIPGAPTSAPIAEAITPAIGVIGKYAAEKHVHERLTTAQYSTTNASGIATVTFTRSFPTKPCPVITADNADGVTGTVISWVQDGSNNYTGATIRATRRAASLNLVQAVVALVNVVTGVTITNTDAPVPNQLLSIIMLAQSTP